MNSNFGESLRRLPGPILVTGHTGFKGTWLTLLLEKLNVPVVGISLPPEPNSLYSLMNRENKIAEKFIDIRNLSELESTIKKFAPSAVLHMAAQPLVLESYESPISTFEVNVIGSANLLQSCLNTVSVKTIGVITTDKVYRNIGSKRSFIESDPLEGRDPYSASKVGTESVVTAWREISMNRRGPQIFSLRAGNVIGGGDRASNRLLPDIVKSKLYENPLQVRNPQSTRPWQHVLDPLHGYLLALEKSLKNEIAPAYNFGPSSESLTVETVINIANKAWGNSIDIEKSDNSKNDKYEADDLAIDASLSSKDLDWSPIWSPIDAVTSTINWWRQVSTGAQTAYQSCLHDIEYLLTK